MTHTRQRLGHELRRSRLDKLTGTLVCTWLALTASLVGRSLAHPLALLALFVPALGVIARTWGLAAAMLGLAASVSVLCAAPFVPLGQMEVTSAGTRTGLFWIVLFGASAAYVFARPQPADRGIREGGKPC